MPSFEFIFQFRRRKITPALLLIKEDCEAGTDADRKLTCVLLAGFHSPPLAPPTPNSGFETAIVQFITHTRQKQL